MTIHLCKRCGAQHDLVYRVIEGGDKELLYRCTKTREDFMDPRVEGLNIPTVLSKKAKQEQRKLNQPVSLFDTSQETSQPTPPKTPAEYAVTIRFDGGCHGNPGRKYGSYRIEDDLVVVSEESRFDLGFGTNNEAEFEGFVRALQNLREIFHRNVSGLKPCSTWPINVWSCSVRFIPSSLNGTGVTAT